MPVIGTGGIKATRIDPGQSFEFKFDKAGEYFYICYIHKGMVGKGDSLDFGIWKGISPSKLVMRVGEKKPDTGFLRQRPLAPGTIDAG